MNRNLCLLALLVISLSSCHSGGERKPTELFPVSTDNVFGFMNRAGKFELAPQFSAAGIFRDGVALVATNGAKRKWGFIDKSGKYIVQPLYDTATIYAEGIAFVTSDENGITAIDNKGTKIFTLPDGIMNVHNFSDGLARIEKITDSGPMYGFINKEGKIEIVPDYINTDDFSEGLCAVKTTTGKYGFINKEGKMTIDPQFDMAWSFSNGIAEVAVGNKWGAIDKKGAFIITAQYDALQIDGDRMLVKQNGKFGWIDHKNNMVINCVYDDAVIFNQAKYTPVKVGADWGYIDKDGKLVIQPAYGYGTEFDGDLAVVADKSGLKFIDIKNNTVVQNLFSGVSLDYIIDRSTGGTLFAGIPSGIPQFKAIAYTWLTGLYQMKFDMIKGISTEDTRKMIDYYAEFSTMMPDSTRERMKHVSVIITNSWRVGGSGRVEYISSDQPAKKQQLDLRKEDNGPWLVSWTKNDDDDSAAKQ